MVDMRFLVKRILIIAMCFWLSGCSLHFKGEKIELDAERQRVQQNQSYDLAAVAVLDDSGGL